MLLFFMFNFVDVYLLAILLKCKKALQPCKRLNVYI